MIALTDQVGEESDYGFDCAIDEDGFPSIESPPSEHAANGEDGPIGNGIEEEEEGFASDFYSCGGDWSSLLSEEPIDEGPSRKKLKQTDLFQSWGLKKPNPPTISKSPLTRQADLFQMWGLKKPHQSISKSHPNKSVSISGGSINRHRERSKATPAATSFSNPPRVCPFYKKIPGTPFTVDAFRYGNIEGCSAYFLTHFHSDHYGGLTKKWCHGPIYCTPITARLLTMSLYVNQSFIHPLELNAQHEIQGITVTMLEANHCPGAALIHFRLSNTQSYLHTGDFRACKSMQSYPLLLNQRVNVLYLDTTYCNPKYKFPSKEDVLSFVVRITKNWIKKQPKTLVVVGAYSIGKECVYLAISKALGVKVYANASRRRVLQSFGWPELSGNLCSQGRDTPLHVMPMSHLRFEALQDYLKAHKDQYSAVLAFRPTGWTFSETIGNQLDLIKPSSKGNVTIYGVPYSEHSSFTELREFVRFLRPDKIIPTVNVGNAATRDKMQSYFREWQKV